MKSNFPIETFEAYAQQFIGKHHIPGAGLGLNQDGKCLYAKGFGFRDVEKELEVTADTIFGIASMTKSFTCIAIMQLQEAGKLSIQDKVVTHLPDFRTPDVEKNNQITIHHLMTHTSGLPPISTHLYARKRSIEQDPSAKDYGLDLVNNPGDPIDTYAEMLNFIAEFDYEMLGPPGVYYSYSNDSYGLLGAIISRVSGQSYEDYITEHILKPANMKRSFFDLTYLDNYEDVTTLYAARKSEEGVSVYAAPLWWDAPAMRATGYLKSTVNDMLTYLEVFRNKGIVNGKRIVTIESVEQMMYPHVEYEPGNFYGYGLRVTPDYFGSTLISHGGGLKGVSSYMCVVPEQELTGVVLTNLSDVPAGNLLLSAMNVLGDREPNATHVHFHDSDESFENPEEWVGSYTSGEGMRVNVEYEDGQLRLRSNGTPNVLRCIGKNYFIGTKSGEEDTIQFIVNQLGEVDRIFYATRQIMKDRY